MITRLSIFIAVCSFGFAQSTLPVSLTQAQEPIVLRDLSLVRNVAIESFNDSGVQLSNGEVLHWDKILKANVSPNEQAKFDDRIANLGLPVFRLKTRIANDDWGGAGEIAEPLFESMLAGETTPDTQTAYLISLAEMKSRLYQGERERAVVAFLRTASLQKNADRETLELVKYNRLADEELETQLSNSILPTWFDLENLKVPMKLILNEVDERPGAMIYLASMRIELGDLESADLILRRLSNFEDATVQDWKTILNARLKQKRGDSIGAGTLLNECSGEGKVAPIMLLARFYVGLNCLADDQNDDNSSATDAIRSKGILSLLSIPALHGETYPHLSAAALFHSAEIAKLRQRSDEAQKLRDELLKRYPQTYHGGYRER